MKVRIELYNFGIKRSEFEKRAASMYEARELAEKALADLGYTGERFSWNSKIKVGPFVDVKFNVYR